MMRTSCVHKTIASLVDSSHSFPSSVEFRSVNIIPNPTYHRSRPNHPFIVPSQVRLRCNVRNNGKVHNTPSFLSYPLVVLRRSQPIKGPAWLTLRLVPAGTAAVQM